MINRKERLALTLHIPLPLELHADVQVGVAIISGQISGHVTAREYVEIKGTARIIGDIVSPVLVLEEGVIFNGRCKMKGEELQVVEKTS